jgi:hypothetical protein
VKNRDKHSVHAEITEELYDLESKIDKIDTLLSRSQLLVAENVLSTEEVELLTVQLIAMKAYSYALGNRISLLEEGFFSKENL